ncbi:MAG TPA: thioredoxin family protein [Planctomycetota bacterium]|nr:thioredoxin family protein [Planctomycetota bacterium]
MEIRVFGKQNCGKCESTKHKVQHFIEKLGLLEAVSMTFFDMDTVDGMAEGAFCDVFDVPTTIIKDNGRDLVRWDGVVPDSLELKQHFAGTA